MGDQTDIIDQYAIAGEPFYQALGDEVMLYQAAYEERCAFRRKRPAIPTESGHLFRSKTATFAVGLFGWRDCRR